MIRLAVVVVLGPVLIVAKAVRAYRQSDITNYLDIYRPRQPRPSTPQLVDQCRDVVAACTGDDTNGDSQWAEFAQSVMADIRSLEGTDR